MVSKKNNDAAAQTSISMVVRKMNVLCMALLSSLLSVGAVAAVPSPPLSPLAPVDTAAYSSYSFVRFVSDKDSVKLTDEEFYDLAAKITFPVNKYNLPNNDSIVKLLERDVFPLINQDSLRMVKMILRGAASPEGPLSFNKFVGQKRADTLLNFVKKHIEVPEDFEMEIDIEDYRTLCIMMHRRGDPDYGYVQAICDQYLPKNQLQKLKSTLSNARSGRLWLRLYSEYFPRLRSARIMFFFRQPLTYAKKVLPEVDLSNIVVEELPEPEPPVVEVPVVTPVPPVVEPVTERPAVTAVTELPRREFLSLKTNVLYDFAYMPGYDRWCPIPNVAVEYYPKGGHFTFGGSFDFPWWQDYDAHKYFQVRNYQLESRYYLKGSRPYSSYTGGSGDDGSGPHKAYGSRSGERGAAFSGFYLQGYVHGGLYSIMFDADRGWEGEGFGGGLGLGYVMPLTRSGHWRLEFGAQFGYFYTKYDPYVYEHPVYDDLHDDLYYYDWLGSVKDFSRRAHRYSWLGPTRIGVTLTYDLLYRRQAKKGVSFKSIERKEEEP